MFQGPNYSESTDAGGLNESGIIRECIEAVRRMKFLQSALEAAKEIRTSMMEGFNILFEGTELEGALGGIADEVQQSVPQLLQSIEWAQSRFKKQLLQLSESARRQVADMLGDFADAIQGEINLD